jgi:hypothetical protein
MWTDSFFTPREFSGLVIDLDGCSSCLSFPARGVPATLFAYSKHIRPEKVCVTWIQSHAQREHACSCCAVKEVTVVGNVCPALSADATAAWLAINPVTALS